MQNNRDEQSLQKIRRRNIGISALLCLICIAALILPVQGKDAQPYAFESAAGIDPAAAQAQWQASGENEDLYRLALALCRQCYLEGEAFDPAGLQECGRELYRRAKAETLDLEAIGNPEDSLAMFELLRSFGVTPAES